ncbi:YncE family protein [Inhella gelatinilytica]|uniref:YncE family protein n=1 Tax=Inhella gelatinilytica TaxID=2795030 RepID=A0A931IYU0_9BURK|nr:YncE family protein [Inhella gelatinilytica]MBH9552503.1 YncE family protein [Inhella gelatinilytica]
MKFQLVLWAAVLAAGGGRAQDAKPPVFVLNSLSASVSVIDRDPWRERTRIPVGKEPHHLYLTPDETSLIVANARADSLTFIDPRTAQVQRVVSGIADPYHLRFSPDMKWFVTAANRLNHVDLYRWKGVHAEQPFELVKRIPSGRTPSHLFIDNASRTLYASMQDSDELLAVDLASQSVLWKVPVGKTPADIYLTPDERHLLVALTGARSVQIWQLRGGEPPKLAGHFDTGEGAHSFRSLGDGQHVLVSNRAGNTISKLDLKNWTLVETYPAPDGPDDMDLLTDGRTLLVTSRWAGRLSVIDRQERKVVAQIKVGRSPHGVWTLDHLPRR